MTRAYIGIGSNLGDRHRNCIKALKMIGGVPGCRVSACSDWYLTQPVGVKEQDWYVNGVTSIDTGIPARHLLENLLDIETRMGRVRKGLWDPRIIDLDILLFGKEIIQEEGLRVPHPLMHIRRFVLVPFAQLDPDLIHPSLGVSMAELLHKLPDDEQVVLPMKE